MRERPLPRSWVWFALAMVACGGSAAPGVGGNLDAGTSAETGEIGKTGAIPCAVDALLATRCRQCHASTPTFGAPMPLVSYADLTAPAKSDPTKKVYELVGARIHDEAHPMPQPPYPRLSATEASTLDGWVLAKAPSSSDPCTVPVPAVDGGVAPLACTADVHLKSPTPWAMPAATTDVYVCYGFDVTTATKRHVVAMAPEIDNSKIVHHVLLFQSDTAVSPTPAPCSGGVSYGWRIVYAWAPGGTNIELPKEAGFPQEGTTHYVVQVHYNNLAHLAGETDSSGFGLCSTDQLRPHDADVLAFGTQKFTIPPHATVDRTCSMTIPNQPAFKDLHVIAAMPHMHKLGMSIATVSVPGGTGTPVDLGAKPMFDFGSQAWVPVNQVVTNGDVVQTRCVWNNPTDATVQFGENTTDEMCYSFTMYYPKIAGPLFTWASPALSSTCK